MKRILLADDEEVLRMLIVDTLEEEGYHIDEAEDGIAALKLFEQNEYDLMIIDYMMPGLTGLEVVERIKEIDNRPIKTLMLTAKSQQSDKEQVLASGVDYYMAKPFSPLKLAELVEDIFNV